MRTELYKLLAVFIFYAAIVANAQTALSALGGSVDSIETDTKALSVQRHAVTTHTGYTVHELNSAGNTVREYVSPEGIVFGIAWNGIVTPDLLQLLGSYASEYQESLQQTEQPKGRRHFQVTTPGVVVQKWGHMRSWQGRAYAPALIPPDVNVDEIK